MNETQDKFLDLMQTVLDEIKTSENDYSAHLLNTCLSHLTEANKDYLDVIHQKGTKWTKFSILKDNKSEQ